MFCEQFLQELSVELKLVLRRLTFLFATVWYLPDVILRLSTNFREETVYKITYIEYQYL